MSKTERITRLRWQCRRGMLELDLILLDILANIESMPDADMDTFEELLTFTDPELFAWFMGHESPPASIYHDFINTYSR